MTRTEHISAQRASGIAIGDKVTVLRKVVSYEDGWGCGALDDSGMNNSVGRTAIVKEVNDQNGILVDTENGVRGWWPYFALKKGAGKPAEVINMNGNTAIIIDGKATLIGCFTKAELQRIIPELY